MNIITLHLTCAGHELSQRMMEYKIYECRPPTRTRMQSGSASHPLQENTVTNSMSTSRISQCIPFIKHLQSPGSRHLWARLGFWEYAITHGLLPNSGYKDLRASQTLVCWTNIFHIIIFKLFKKWLDGFKIPSLSSHSYISTRFLRKKINNAQKSSSKIPPPIHPPFASNKYRKPLLRCTLGPTKTAVPGVDTKLNLFQRQCDCFNIDIA